MGDSLLKISPARQPFQYHAWFELPFPLAVKVNEQFVVDYKSFSTKIDMTIFSNVYKIVTGSFWQQSREVEEWAARVQSGKTEPPSLSGWIQEYVTKDRVSELVKELEKQENTRYVHVERISGVVHVMAPIPADVIPTQDFNVYDLSPQISFISEELFPVLQRVIDTYRIAAYPWMRYAISPISEALVDRAFIHFTDKENIRIGNNHHCFDVKSPIAIGETPAIQLRFDQFLPQISTLQDENQMASAYYLYRMRRWTEAITLASAVVDSLLKDLVRQIASTEIESEAIWIAYGRKYQDLFNEVLPKLGKPKLSVINKPLWDDFVEAKKRRGSKVHGNYSESFDKQQEEDTKRYLAAFHDVAGWIIQQNGTNWALDCSDENNNKLKPFP